MKPTRYRRQTLALFFIVSLVPALTVASIWYVNTQLNDSGTLEISFQSFVLPIFVIGILPAIVLSFAFAELLSAPVRRIKDVVEELTKGNFKARFHSNGAGEFHEIADGLDRLASRLERTLSEAASERAIIEAERNKLRGVLDSMTDGVFALDRDGRIILFNKAAAELTGRSITEVAGQLAEKVMPFRQHGELVMTRWLATERGDSKKIGQWHGLELYRADGSSLYVDVQAVVVPHDPDGISGLVTFHDLTKGHQLEEMKVDFVALSAHELRTPLTEIRGYLDILKHEAKGLSKTNREFLERSADSAEQLSRLVNNLLGVARIEHGELNYLPQRLDYRALVDSLGKELTARTTKGGRKLSIKLPTRLPEIWADAGQLREVIDNLVENAIAYTTTDKGTITIAVKQTGGEIETTVTDNGAGIPSDALPHLFTKFYRVDELKMKTRGTGLGLYICRSIVEAHGGHIWVESIEGKGSTFGFRLPTGPVAPTSGQGDNTTNVTGGVHGWIKNHSLH